MNHQALAFVSFLTALALGSPSSASPLQVIQIEEAASPLPAGLEAGNGAAVVLSGNQLLVGAPNSTIGMNAGAGMVLVHDRSGHDWLPVQSLTASLPVGGADFGRQLATDFDRLLVSAPGGTGVTAGSGSVAVFRFDGVAWQPETDLSAVDGASGDLFGTAIALSENGSLALVGAPGDDDAANSSGSAYLFQRSGTSWSFVAKLVAPDAAAGDAFGSAVGCSVDGTTRIALVSSPTDDDVQAGSGSVYAFEETMPGVWGFVHKFQAPAPEFNAFFGRALSVESSSAIIGAPRSDLFAMDGGVAYAFERGMTGTWGAPQILQAADAADDELFGSAVHFTGNLAAIGARQERRGIFLEYGAAYLFERPGAGMPWTAGPKLIASDAQPGDQLATGVHVGQNLVAAGAGDPFLMQGRAYTFLREPLLTVWCFGDVEPPATCTLCPCGNSAMAGKFGGCVHSGGQSARLVVTGQPSASNDTLRFEAHALPASVFALLQSGNALLPMPGGACPPGSGIQSANLDGLRCIGSNILRHGVRLSDASGSLGVTNAAWGAPDGPAGGLVAHSGAVVGQSRAFQLFFRDMPLASCLQGIDTTNAVLVQVTP